MPEFLEDELTKKIIAEWDDLIYSTSAEEVALMEDKESV